MILLTIKGIDTMSWGINISTYTGRVYIMDDQNSAQLVTLCLTRKVMFPWLHCKFQRAFPFHSGRASLLLNKAAAL